MIGNNKSLRNVVFLIHLLLQSTTRGKKTKLFFSPNRFSALSADKPSNDPDIADNNDVYNQNESEHVITQTRKIDLPPPIYVKGTINFAELRNAINEIIGPDSFICKSTT